MSQSTFKSFAILDTNVLIVVVIQSDKKSSHARTIMQNVREGNIIPIVDRRILDEYLDVMQRTLKGQRASSDFIQTLMNTLIERSLYVSDVEHTKVEIWDQGDIPFFEIMEHTLDLDSRLITNNIKDFKLKMYDRAGNVLPRQKTDPRVSERILTPKEYLDYLDKMQTWVNIFVKNKEEAQKSFNEVVANFLRSGKYKRARDVLTVKNVNGKLCLEYINEIPVQNDDSDEISFVEKNIFEMNDSELNEPVLKSNNGKENFKTAKAGRKFTDKEKDTKHNANAFVQKPVLVCQYKSEIKDGKCVYTCKNRVTGETHIFNRDEIIKYMKKHGKRSIENLVLATNDSIRWTPVK